MLAKGEKNCRHDLGQRSAGTAAYLALAASGMTSRPLGVLSEYSNHGRQDAEERGRQTMRQHSVETVRVCGAPHAVAALLERYDQRCESGYCDCDLSDGLELPEFSHVGAPLGCRRPIPAAGSLYA